MQQVAGNEILPFHRPFHEDRRGAVIELYNAEDIGAMLGFRPTFVQDMFATSIRNVLRGMHYQINEPQGKLISVLTGSILDIAVDLREGSNTFLSTFSMTLDADGEHNSIWIPEGFAHGYLVLSQNAAVHYKVTRHRKPEFERRIKWNDPALGIDWRIETPVLSDADACALGLAAALEELAATRT